MAVNIVTEMLLQGLFSLPGLVMRLWVTQLTKTTLHTQQAQKLSPEWGSELDPFVHPNAAHGSKMYAAGTSA